MAESYDNVLRQYSPAFYVCTGDEVEGIQDCTIDGVTYYFYLANIHPGAVIRYEEGRFMTNDPTMTITIPTHSEEEIIPPSASQNTLELEGTGQGGTPEAGAYYGTLPEELRGQNNDILKTNDVDGTPHLFVKQDDVWVEIPLISAEEVERLTGGSLDLKMINFEQINDIVEVS